MGITFVRVLVSWLQQFSGGSTLKIVGKEINNYQTLKRFLVAFFFLSVGVQTIILLATIFGSTELGLGTINLIITVLLIQVVAIFGAWFFSNISQKYGNFKALKITVLIWVLVCLAAFMLHKDLPNYSSNMISL